MFVFLSRRHTVSLVHVCKELIHIQCETAFIIWDVMIRASHIVACQVHVYVFSCESVCVSTSVLTLLQSCCKIQLSQNTSCHKLCHVVDQIRDIKHKTELISLISLKHFTLHVFVFHAC